MNNNLTQPINQEAKGLIISLRQRKYEFTEITEILNNLGFEVTPLIVTKIWRLYDEKIQARDKKEPRRPAPSMLDSEKIKQMTYLFLNNQEMTVNKASQLFGIGKQNIRRYMIQFGIGCTKGKGQKLERYTFKRYNLGKLTEEELEEIEREEQNKFMNRPLIQEPGPIDPLSDRIWKKVEIRIIFPKIRYGQCHQWERYYDRLTKEVTLQSLRFLDFKKGEKFTGKGCYIYILSEFDQNVYLDNFTLEKFLETSLPEDFFAGNCLNTNKIRVFDYPYIPQNIPQEDIINLNVLSKEEIFMKINNKIRNMNEQEQKQLNDLAQQIHIQYQTDQHNLLINNNGQGDSIIQSQSLDINNTTSLNNCTNSNINNNCTNNSNLNNNCINNNMNNNCINNSINNNCLNNNNNNNNHCLNNNNFINNNNNNCHNNNNNNNHNIHYNNNNNNNCNFNNNFNNNNNNNNCNNFNNNNKHHMLNTNNMNNQIIYDVEEENNLLFSEMDHQNNYQYNFIKSENAF